MAKPVILDVHVNGNDPDAMKQLFLSMRPEWSGQDIKITKLLGGLRNELFCGHLSTDINREHAFVIRIFPEGEQFSRENDIEIQNLQIAQNLGISPEMIAVFENGVIYKFVRGRMLVFADSFNPDFISLQMQLLAKVHSSMPEKMQFYNRKGISCAFMKIYQSTIMKDLIKSVEEDISDFKDIPRFNGRKALIEEWEKIEEQLKLRNMPMVLNHADFHMNNLIYSDDGRLTLIDYPSMCYTYEAYDLGFMFCAYDFLKIFGRIPEGQPDYDENIKDLFCRYYLKHKLALPDISAVDNDRLQSFKADCNAMQPLAIFGTLAICMAKHGTGEIQFDTKLLMKKAVECYNQKKHFLFQGKS